MTDPAMGAIPDEALVGVAGGAPRDSLCNGEDNPPSGWPEGVPPMPSPSDDEEGRHAWKDQSMRRCRQVSKSGRQPRGGDLSNRRPLAGVRRGPGASPRS